MYVLQLQDAVRDTHLKQIHLFLTRGVYTFTFELSYEVRMAKASRIVRVLSCDLL